MLRRRRTTTARIPGHLCDAKYWIVVVVSRSVRCRTTGGLAVAVHEEVSETFEVLKELDGHTNEHDLQEIHGFGLAGGYRYESGSSIERHRGKP